MGDEGCVSVDGAWKPQTKIGREARTTRIVQRLCEGWGCDEVAGEEKVTVRRVRQIIAQYLKDRETPEGADHALMQIDRLGWAMRVASEAMAKGDIRAIGPFMRAVDRLDRYQAPARQRTRAPEPADKGDSLVVAELMRRVKAQVKDEAVAEARAELAAAAGPPPALETVAVEPPAVAVEAPFSSSEPHSTEPLSAQPPQNGAITNFFPFIRP